ncbi:MAG TPA: 3-isopropylmalate dehydratase small subunit [Herpetosiphon sp.]|uniref:3-isopropylmalate dehydratase small subunit n=1 Tax=Herpetosiphon aurantiacus (strain ATCC 23779 / DSM 785 / 114-95) TaxID=316274 RepID=LEUD_HERA2|nr:3-isopropylmalate dehydratase small subunit [Herpetosiphon sp.]A9AZ32.1 RecName: Full=3-isopropylmalate dehydratase small subunit; AltName: Full=Alpha-IPM isomerase; Short=IPMI; AltName: Full=Isopropylmalate isomerase [Herpetosiphon aurantiacus DSM 785]ABX07072.1 3-isopropylmalate dehydratase, small subunit [Herpetosiphon aurantiacus DSM 785]HBW50963.1 3-isopropylmalate dehydratase small subunit [Herpetosiphon sp.]
MQPINTFQAKAVALPIENIDTDQIIPARYLKVTDKNGLGEALFTDWRGEPDFVLNQPYAQGAGVLIAGHNFGCGSSREHAPWALQGFGFQAVISTYFADIFKGNALKNGLLPIVVDAPTLARLTEQCLANQTIDVSVDLENQQVHVAGETISFPIDAFSKHCLLHGVDQLGYIQAQETAIQAYEASHAARVNTVGA